jgi:hypothetical protein
MAVCLVTLQRKQELNTGSTAAILRDQAGNEPPVSDEVNAIFYAAHSSSPSILRRSSTPSLAVEVSSLRSQRHNLWNPLYHIRRRHLRQRGNAAPSPLPDSSSIVGSLSPTSQSRPTLGLKTPGVSKGPPSPLPYKAARSTPLAQQSPAVVPSALLPISDTPLQEKSRGESARLEGTISSPVSNAGVPPSGLRVAITSPLQKISTIRPPAATNVAEVAGHVPGQFLGPSFAHKVATVVPLDLGAPPQPDQAQSGAPTLQIPVPQAQTLKRNWFQKFVWDYKK